MRRHSDPSLLSFPPGSPLSFPPGSPLSFPPGFSGNPGSCSSGPLFGGPRVGKTRGFPIKDVGNDSGGDYQRWNDSGGIWGASVSLLSFPQGSSLSFPPVSPLSFPQGSPLSFPPGFSGNPGDCSSVLSFGRACLGKIRGFPIKDVGNDGGGLKMSGMTRGGTTGVLSGAGLS